MVALTNISATFPQRPLRVRGQNHTYRLGAELCSKSSSRANLRGATYAECNRLESCSKDPILFTGSPFNLYEYTFASPINYGDPTGLACVGNDPPECKACDAVLAAGWSIATWLCVEAWLHFGECMIGHGPWRFACFWVPPTHKVACCATIATAKCLIYYGAAAYAYYLCKKANCPGWNGVPPAGPTPGPPPPHAIALNAKIADDATFSWGRIAKKRMNLWGFR
jgi:hypothetical protein